MLNCRREKKRRTTTRPKQRHNRSHNQKKNKFPLKLPVRVLISGGGTGGHVFPAIAIANALRKIDPALQIRFIGAEGKLEMQKVPEAGYEIDGLWISGFQRDNVLKNLQLPFKIVSSLIKAFGI